MKASEAGHGDLSQFNKTKAEQREKDRRIKATKAARLVSSATKNGMRITFSTAPVKGEVSLAKTLRKQYS